MLDQTFCSSSHTGALASRSPISQSLVSELLTDEVSDYKDDGTNVLLDANENAYGPSLALDGEGKLSGSQSGSSKPEIDFLGLNRYPDP